MTLHVLETLAFATDDNKLYQPQGHYSIQNYQLNGLNNHYRAHSYPITLRPRKSAHHQSKSHKEHYSKHHHSRHKKQPEAESTSSVFDGRSFGLRGKKITIQPSRWVIIILYC